MASECSFYRVQGYHLTVLGQAEEAKAARLRALELIRKLLASGKDQPVKRLTYIHLARTFRNLHQLRARSVAPSAATPKQAV